MGYGPLKYEEPQADFDLFHSRIVQKLLSK